MCRIGEVRLEIGATQNYLKLSSELFCLQKKINLFFSGWTHLCHGVHVTTTGQLVGVSSLHRVGQGIELHRRDILLSLPIVTEVKS